MLTEPIYDQQPGEQGADYHKFLLFRDMPAQDRSFLAAYQMFLEARPGVKKREKARPESKPHSLPGSWQALTDNREWRKRADAYDRAMLKERDQAQARLLALEEEEEARLISSGLARIARRVEALSQRADDLKASWHDPATGEIVYQWLTPDKIREYRGCLADIAKELGARANKTELTGKDGGAIEFSVDWGGGAIEEKESDQGAQE